MQTRCPHCHTLFSVSTEQLKTYAGRVRCGNCRQVFNAFDSLNQPVVETQRIPALQRRPTPFLRDINPRLEINFGNASEAGAESIVHLDIDDDEFNALNSQNYEEDESYEENEGYANEEYPDEYDDEEYEESRIPENFETFEKMAQKTSIFLDPPVDLPSTQIFEQKLPKKVKDALQVQIELAPSLAPDNIDLEDVPPKTIAPDDLVMDDLPSAPPPSGELNPDLLESKINALEIEFEKEDKEWRKKARERRRAEKEAELTAESADVAEAAKALEETPTMVTTAFSVTPSELPVFSTKFICKEDLLTNAPNEPDFKTPTKKSPKKPSVVEEAPSEESEQQAESAESEDLTQSEESSKASESPELSETSELTETSESKPSFLDNQSIAANDEPEAGDDVPAPPLPSISEKPSVLRPRQKITKEMVAIIVLGVIFVLQAFVLLRDGIVKSAPGMRSVYTALGLSLPLQKELSLLTIESSDLNIDNANGIFKLQATLGNHARFNQAWPNLELVLTDSLDQVIVRRVLRPKEYLKDPNLSSFKAQSEDHIQLWLEAKNVEAVGYRLSVFYPNKGTT